MVVEGGCGGEKGESGKGEGTTKKIGLGWIECGGGVCGSDDSKHAVSVQGHADYAPNWVAEHLGVRLPATPPPPSPRALTGVSARGLKKPD